MDSRRSGRQGRPHRPEDTAPQGALNDDTGDDIGVERRIGAELRRARQAQGIDLARPALTLRIGAAYLQALEDGRFDALPGPTYATGFLRAYGDFLGLDGETLAQRLREGSGPAARQRLRFPVAPAEARRPTGIVVGAALALAIAAATVWYLLHERQAVEFEPVPEVPQSLSPAAPPEQAAPGAGEVPVPEIVPAAEEEAAPPVEREAAPATAPPVEPEPPAAAPEQQAAPPSDRAPEPLATTPPAAAPEQEQAPATPATDEATVAVPPADTDQAAVATSLTAEDEAAPPAAAPVEEAEAPPPDPADTMPADTAAPPTATPESAADAGEAPARSSEPPPAAAPPDPTAPAAALADAATATPENPPPAAGAQAAFARPPAGETPATAATPPQADSPTAAVAGPPPRIELRALEETWIRLRRADGSVLFERLLPPGASYFVPAGAAGVFDVGNAGGLVILVDGAALPILGPSGVVVRNLPLDPEALAAR